MSKFNFDDEFFRRVISRSEKATKISPLSGMVREAVSLFFTEYDYYPDLAVFAPGTVTILGDHLEYAKGNLVQAALPMGTVIVGKARQCVKCKVCTSERFPETPSKSVFPVTLSRKNIKVFPHWVNSLRGIINIYPCRDLQGFDALIHSNVPIKRGYGSSAALQVGFFTFLEATLLRKPCKMEMGCLCYFSEKSDKPVEEIHLGSWSIFTSSLATSRTCFRINSRTGEVSQFQMRDINILFLLTYPKCNIEVNDRDLVKRRDIELRLAAKLLGLKDIIDATEEHLNVLANMEDPSKETVISILQDFNLDKSFINEFVEDLFWNPRTPDLIPEDESYEEEEEEIEVTEKEGTTLDEVYGETNEHAVVITEDPCKASRECQETVSKRAPVSYIQQKIEALCAGREKTSNLPERVCEEINCLGGIENLSVASGLTVCSKLLRRVRHIVTENMRCLTLNEVITKLDYEEFGTKLIQSHLSLKLDYEVSCPTLDGLVQLAIDSKHVYGAKMTSGGGTITLLHRRAAEQFIDKVIEKYGDKFYFYLMFPSSGARILNMGAKKVSKSLLSQTYLNLDHVFLKAIENFEATYKYRPTHGAFSPGVVNIIGDYTDGYHGLTLSVAVDMNIVVVGAINGTGKIRVATTCDVGNESQKAIFPTPDVADLRPGNIKWVKIIKGVVAVFKGHVKGFDCLIQTSIPLNSGVLSKPALVMGFYTFLEELSGDKCTTPEEKSYLCMLAMHEFSRALFGVSEQLVISKTKENCFVLVDSRSVSTTLIPFEDPSVTLLLICTGAKIPSRRALLYTRLEECNSVAVHLGRRSLRCLTTKELDEVQKTYKKKINEKYVRRAAYVVSENERVLKAAEALRNCDYETLGELMVASHKSLRDDFEVINSDMDYLVATTLEVDGVLGSKALCSGYLNCALSLVKHWAADDLIEHLRSKVCRKLTFYIVNTSGNCGSLNLAQYTDELPSPEFIFEHVFPF